MFDSKRKLSHSKTLYSNNPDLIAPLIEVKSFERRSTIKPSISSRLSKNLNLNNPKTDIEIIINKSDPKFITSTYAEDKSISSSKSITLFVLTLVISSLQLGVYRYVVNNSNNVSDQSLNNNADTTSSSGSFLDEITFFCWRMQSIFVLLLLYIIASIIFKFDFPFFPMFTKSPNVRGQINSNTTDYIFTLENLKFSSVNLFSTCVFFYSTKFLPLGLISLLISFDVLGVLNFKNNVSKIDLIPTGLLYLGTVLISYFIFQNSFSLDFYYTGMNMIICFILCIGSLFLTRKFYMPIFEEKLNKNIKPSRIVFTLYANNLILSFFLLIITQICYQKFNAYTLIGWIFEVNLIINFGLVIGCLGLLFVLLTFVSSYYLNTDCLKALKYGQIPLVDLLGFFVFGLYHGLNLTFLYLIGMIHLLFGLLLKDFVLGKEETDLVKTPK